MQIMKKKKNKKKKQYSYYNRQTEAVICSSTLHIEPNDYDIICWLISEN